MSKTKSLPVMRDWAEGLEPSAPLPHSAVLGLEAEILVTVRLLIRSRVVRFATVLGVVMVGWYLSSSDVPSTGVAQRVLLLLAGSLGAVSGAEVLGVGPPAQMLRRAGGHLAVHASGRLVGVLAVVLPPLLAVSAVLADGEFRVFVEFVVAAALLGAAVAGFAASMSSTLGAAPAGAVAVLAVWLGFLNPDAVAVLIDGLPGRNVVLWLWHGLPLSWRADAALGVGASTLLLGSWALGGFFAGTLRAVASGAKRAP